MDILKGKAFLVVEDEETNWFLIRDILQNHKALVTWAEVGSKAIDLVKTGHKYDAILMDINLPAMDGLEVTQNIKAIDPTIPIIAQTAFAQDEEIQRCYDVGCIAHVLKPFTVGELTNTIIEVLEQK